MFYSFKILFLVIVYSICIGAQAQQQLPDYETYIKNNIPDKKEIDVFLNDKTTWAKFDPEVGYTLGNFMPHDGIDKSGTLSTIGTNGARTSFMYAGKPCRINSYGNSFTQCHQVSDGETWQEYLAAHLGEPIRNFGMGGHGTYQAYRRMIREEKSKNAAEYVIFYIWGDDHLRSLLRCRYMLFKEWTNTMSQREGIGKMFHNNFWSNIEMDMEKGVLVEKKNRIPVAKDLYKMTDPEWMYENLRDDLALQILLYLNDKTSTFDTISLKKLAAIYQQSFHPEDPAKVKQHMRDLINKYALSSTIYTLQKVKAFTEANHKKLMVVLFDPGVMFSLAKGGERYEQIVVDYLQENKINYFDMNLAHLEDYKDFKISFEDYWKRYSIGHYSPSGNHFFAFSIKSKIVEWLNPKPITYKDQQQQAIDFKGYLLR